MSLERLLDVYAISIMRVFDSSSRTKLNGVTRDKIARFVKGSEVVVGSNPNMVEVNWGEGRFVRRLSLIKAEDREELLVDLSVSNGPGVDYWKRFSVSKVAMEEHPSGAKVFMFEADNQEVKIYATGAVFVSGRQEVLSFPPLLD